MAKNAIYSQAIIIEDRFTEKISHRRGSVFPCSWSFQTVIYTQILRYETHIIVVLCSPERMHSLTMQYALIHRYLQFYHLLIRYCCIVNPRATCSKLYNTAIPHIGFHQPIINNQVCSFLLTGQHGHEHRNIHLNLYFIRFRVMSIIALNP